MKGTSHSSCQLHNTCVDIATPRRRSWWAALILISTFGTSLEPQTVRSGDLVPSLIFDSLPVGVRRVLEAAYREAQENPGDASRVGHLAMLLHAPEQLAAAEVCYRRAQTLEPHGFAWPYLAAITQAERGDQAGAIQSFRAALTIDPTHPPARVRLADAFMRAGDFDAGAGEYTSLVRDAPELAAAHYGLGRFASARRDASYRNDDQYQMVANVTWLKGSHNIRFGSDVYHTTRSWQYSFCVRDQWQVSPKMTLSFGTRYEYFPIPTRADRGLERYNLETNMMEIGGLGSVPTDLGIPMQKNLFSPRLGVTYRVTQRAVVRGGFGVTNDPYSLARPMRTNHPVLTNLVDSSADSFTWVRRIRLGF